MPDAATTAHVFPQLQPHSLISIGQLCDSGCTATFTASSLAITNADDETVLTGNRTAPGLWQVPIHNGPKFPSATQSHHHSQPPKAATYDAAVTPLTTTERNETANAVIPSHNLGALMQYLHACLFSPTKSTLLRAIRANCLTTWPKLTTDNINKYWNKTDATVMGHLDQRKQNIQSTKEKPQTTAPSIAQELLPQTHRAQDNEERSHNVFCDVSGYTTAAGQIFTDQTGRFPITSASGNQYVMVLYDYDSNAIIVHALKNRTASEILRAYKTLHAILLRHGLKPQLQRLDNEASRLLKDYMHTQDVQYQLAPPYNHRSNTAERAIRTFKNHFLAGLCSTDPLFPMQLWDTLLPQAQLTLNLLRTSHINPKLSAYAQIFGAYNFKKNPCAPPGTRVIIHDKPQTRASWAPHGTHGWYIGPAMEHYRCYTCRTATTYAERISDTVEFFPRHTPLPEQTPAEKLAHATTALTHALQHWNANSHPATRVSLPPPTIFFPLPHDPKIQNTPAETRVHTANALLPIQRAPDTPLQDILIVNECPPRHLPKHYANAVLDVTTGKHLEYRHLIKLDHTKVAWLKSGANEFGCLAQGLKSRKIHGTNTISFINKKKIPLHKRVTYARFVCSIRPQKEEQERTRLTVGGNLIHYDGPKNAPTADITTYKMHINSTLSRREARMLCLDIKNYYLGTDLPSPEFMKIHISLIPQEIIDEYNLLDIIDEDGFIYIEINKGMYGLPQAGRLANDKLAVTLAPHGFYQARHTPGLWLHQTLPISFVLVVDDFAIQYTDRTHADMLVGILKNNYKGITIDWEARLFIGIQVDWNYEQRTATLSMPDYIPKLLQKHQHKTPTKPVYAPHPYTAPNYGAAQQMTPKPDTSEPLDKAGILRVQQIVGSLLYYSRAVDCTLAVTLSTLASEQSKATQYTNEKITQLLDYCATNPLAKLRYHASDMILKIHSDAGYGNSPGFRSRAGGHLYLDTKGGTVSHNGAILNPTGVLKHVATSSAEAEIGALFVNAREGLILRTTLEEMGFPQHCTHIITDNTLAHGFVNDTIKKQRSRAIDMRFHWIQDQREQNKLELLWKPGKENKGDYFTKHHSPAHHQLMRPIYLHSEPNKPKT